MTHEPEYQCPECDSTRLTVVVSMLCDLFYEDGEPQTQPAKHHSDHEWDLDSPTYCCDCQHTGTAMEFWIDPDQDNNQ